MPRARCLWGLLNAQLLWLLLGHALKPGYIWAWTTLSISPRLRWCRFKCAIVLCDQAWLDPDLDHTNGISMRGEGDMLRMDAVITSVQLNIRCLLEVRPAGCKQRIRARAQHNSMLAWPAWEALSSPSCAHAVCRHAIVALS